MSDAVGIALVGAAGRMGLEIARAARGRSELRIVAAIEHAGHPELGRDLGELAGGDPLGVALAAALDRAVDEARVIVDLSQPSATKKVIATAVQRRLALVCGTTGLGAPELASIAEAARRIPVLYTTNLSPGIALLNRLAAEAIRALGPGYDIEIVEAHHRRKKDAPSGTAAELARRICAALGKDPAAVLRYGREGICGPRTPEEIGVHAIRGGDVVGDHTVIFAAEGERVELVHKASSRDVFVRGAIRAAKYLAGRKPGVYSMQDVLA